MRPLMRGGGGRRRAPAWVEAVARRPRAAALAGALFISFSGIFFRFSDTTPATATVFRCLYALPFLGLIALDERRRLGPFERRGHYLAVLAGLLFGADLLAWQHAVDLVGAGLATVVANLQVVVVAALAWLLLRERPSWGVVLAIPVMLGGVALIGGLVGRGAYGADPRLGLLFGLLSAVAYSGYLLLTRQGNLGGLRPATMLFDSSAAAVLAAAVVGGLLGDLNPVPSWPAHGWLLAVALTSQVAGYLLISASLPRLPAALTSAILLAQPVATVFEGGVLLGERPSALQLAGVGLVIAGLLAASMVGRPASDPRATAVREPAESG